MLDFTKLSFYFRVGEKMKIKDSRQTEKRTVNRNEKKLAWENPDVTVLKYEDTSNNPGGGADFNGRAS